MKHNWIPYKLCDVKNRVVGIAVDNNGVVYFTTENENVYCISKDDNDKEPQILVHIKGAALRGIIWNGSNSTLYICDKRHRILMYSITKKKISSLAGKEYGNNDASIKNADIQYPRGIAMDTNGDLYITHQNCIQKIDIDQRTSVTIAGGSREGHKDGKVNQAMFYYPWEMVVSDDGTIYVADWYNHCVRTIKDGVVSTLAGAPSKQGYQDGPFSDAQFYLCEAIHAYDNQTLLVGDSNGLRKLDLTNQVVSTLVPMVTTSICRAGPFEFIVGSRGYLSKVVNTWMWKRWLWIGHLKEKAPACFLAGLPRDVIKEISSNF